MAAALGPGSLLRLRNSPPSVAVDRKQSDGRTNLLIQNQQAVLPLSRLGKKSSRTYAVRRSDVNANEFFGSCLTKLGSASSTNQHRLSWHSDGPGSVPTLRVMVRSAMSQVPEKPLGLYDPANDKDGKLYTARNILISVGGRPFIPDIPGKEYAIDSDVALSLTEKPKRLAVIGGGYEALEIAGIFKGLTTDSVHVFIPQNKALRGFDEEVGDFLGEQMSFRDIEFHTGESPQAILKSPDGTLSLTTNKGTVDGFEQIMFVTDRKPNTENLGLEQVGVKMNKNGAIEVDEYSRTSVPSIWAISDATNIMKLTPVALMEGMTLAKTLFANEPSKPDYRASPSAVFTQPPLGQVGLTEEQAIEKYGDIDVYTTNLRPLKATLSGQPDRVLMKMLVCAKTDKVIGLHMCGEDAPEIIQGFAVAVKTQVPESTEPSSATRSC